MILLALVAIVTALGVIALRWSREQKRRARPVFTTLAVVLALVTPIAVVGLPSASASVGPVDDRLNTTPTGAWTYGGVSAATVSTLLTSNGARLTDLQVESAVPLTFSVTMVKNTGSYASGWWWYYGQTAAQVQSLLAANGARPISAAPYTADGLHILYAVVMVPNSGTNFKTSAWYGDQTPSAIGTLLSASNSRLTRLQSVTILGVRHYSAIMVSNTGTDNYAWGYYFGQTASQIRSLMTANNVRPVDVDRRSDGLYDIIVYANTTAATSFFFDGASLSSLATRAKALGTRIIDINSYLVNGIRFYAGILLDNSSTLTRKIRAPFLGVNLTQAIGTGNGYFGFELKQVGMPVSAALRETTRYEPASALKVLFHLYAMRAIAAGTASDSTQIPYKTGLTGSCPAGPLASTSLQNAMTLMMGNSDNQMTEAVVDYFGTANIQAYANVIGLTSTKLNHEIGCPTLATLNTTSLADLTKIYEGVENGTLLDPAVKATFYSRMLNQSNYSPFHTFICNLAQQEAVKLGKTFQVSQSFCNAVTWAAKGGDYGIGDGTTNYDFHGGVANYGFPLKSAGVIAAYNHWILGDYTDHMIYAGSTLGTTIGPARTAATNAAIVGPLDQALATW